jgi:dolichol-phosphate mannosyltransferase
MSAPHESSSPSPGRAEGGAAAAVAPPAFRAVSIVVPTYREAENLPHLIDRIDRVRAEHGLDVELLIMDDDSKDGTEEVVAGLYKDWVRLIVRKANRGLSPAVVDGLRAARHDVLVVMDADLSHPPEKIPEMLAALAAGADFVIGSRYVAGGSTDAEWGLLRKLNSKGATFLARPFTRAKDPMAGFFALERRTFARGDAALNPIGYKIGLELLVKCGCRDVREVPIHFTDRKLGSSKLSFKEQLRYLQHLRRLFIYRYWTWSHLAQFLVVGASGVVVNLIVLTVLYNLLHTPEWAAVAGGILVSLVSNFALNRRFTFSYARGESLPRQFAGFAAACALGMVVNYATTLLIRHYLGLNIQLAALIGIVAGMGFNFLCTRYLVFRFKAENPEHYRASG